MKVTSSNLAPWLTALLSLALLPGWLGAAASASTSAKSESPSALPEQDVWLRWKLAHDARQPSTEMTPPPGTPTQANKASSIIGMEVRSPEREYLGRIQDVVLDWQSGRVSYAVVNTAPAGKAKLLAVPPSALKPAADHKHLVLDADKTSIAAASGFDPHHWPSLITPTGREAPVWQGN